MASPINTGALSLAEWAKLTNSPLVNKVTFSLYENESVLQMLPIITRKSMVANGVRWEGNLPTVNWAKLNQAPVRTKGTPTAFQEQAYLIRNMIEIDVKMLDDVNNITDPRGAEIEAYMKSVAYDGNTKFIRNDHSIDPDSFVGLRWRIDNPTQSGVATEMKINAGGVNLAPGSITAASANAFLEYVAQLLSFMKSPDGDGVTLMMNDYMQRKFKTAVATAGPGAGFTTDKDAYDRTIIMFGGARVFDIGREVDQVTRIISQNETAAGADGTASDHYTSIYGVKFGESTFFGWHYETLAAKYLGRDNEGVLDRTLIDYAIGLMQQDTRAIGRIYGILIA